MLSNFVNNFEKQFVSNKHASKIRWDRDQFILKDAVCKIDHFNGNNCRIMYFAEYKKRADYLLMMDSYATLRLIYKFDNKEVISKTHEDVQLDLLHGQLICRSHLWILTRGRM